MVAVGSFDHSGQGHLARSSVRLDGATEPRLRWGYNKDTLTKVLAYIRDEAVVIHALGVCKNLVGVEFQRFS